ncbi:MAG: hypothetical protein EXQ53_02895 [Acidobacteria bacterium]|nr:hypothetical protein [Acidobacteriota bacterium]
MRVGWQTWLAPSLDTGFALLLAVALFMRAITARLMAMRVQDRVIRFELRARMRLALPADLHGRIDELTPEQLVALRFAGDGELPELVRDVLAGRLASQKAIKLKIKDWQGDYLRG